jgi:hypothetical protein
VISGNNAPLNQQSFDSDFTVDSYRELLVIAKQRYAFASYGAIPWGQRFVLWRHDCDYSLNRAHALARIEAAEGVSATYFVNPHSEFYNLFEKKQHSLVLEILGMGHGIGLHFDAAFHNISDESQLSNLVHAEAALLERLYGVRPTAFSFHNPVAAHLSCEEEIRVCTRSPSSIVWTSTCGILMSKFLRTTVCLAWQRTEYAFTTP